MRHVWPLGSPGAELDRAALAVAYAHPASDRPWVRINFVTSVDGAVSVDGVSGGLEAPGDREVFSTLREVADVVLVGAGTARAEGYRGVRTSAAIRARRRARGQADVPPVAVVSTAGDLDPASGLCTDTAVPPLVLTAADAAADARVRLADTGAEVVAVSGGDPSATDPAAVVAALGARGLRRILCEGGPELFGSLLAADLVDELCLSLAPQLAGSGPGRIVAGPDVEGARPMTLASVIAHDHGLMLRYRVSGR